MVLLESLLLVINAKNVSSKQIKQHFILPTKKNLTKLKAVLILRSYHIPMTGVRVLNRIKGTIQKHFTCFYSFPALMLTSIYQAILRHAVRMTV